MTGDGLQIRVLGPLEVLRDGRAVKLGGPKPRVVLALLSLHAGRVVSVDSLIDALWGDDPPAKALGTLQVHISTLRRGLDPSDGPTVILNRAPGYVLDVSPEAVDVTEFHRLAERGRALVADGRPSEAAAVLSRASGLWRGSALADLAGELALLGPATGLDEERLSIREERIAADLQRGAHAEVVGELQALTDELPLREGLWALLILALYRSGRQADALAAYRRARTTLIDELGIEPGRPLQDLEAAVLAQSPGLDLDAPNGGGATIATTVIRAPSAGPSAHVVLPDGTRVAVGARCVIGRHPDCAVVVDDPQASRRHAVIRAAADAHVLADLDSTNGTFINGDLIDERELCDGDEIVVGAVAIRYDVDRPG